MKTARKTVCPALALVKLAACVEPGEHQFDHRCFFFRMESDRNTAPVILDADRTIGMQGDLELLAIACESFIGRVVQHFLDDVQGVIGTRIHARTLLDRLQALQHAYRAFGVFRG